MSDEVAEPTPFPLDATRRPEDVGKSAASPIPDVPGILNAAQVVATAQSIADVQLANGMIPWFPGGHCDPWNHVEAAMALSVCGMNEEVERAFAWLADTQMVDGSWFNYYVATGVKDLRIDTNVCAYVAAGIFHHFLVTADVEVLSRHWSMMEAAIDFVLRWQRSDGAIRWSVDPAGRPEGYGLLTGSSSIYHSLRCAVAVAERLGRHRPDWELAAGRLGHLIAHHRQVFARKDEFAMDWYYPILSGAVDGESGRQRIEGGWDAFFMADLGVRCVSTNDWVTAAETAECAIAAAALGMVAEARQLFSAGQTMRLSDGSYWTGVAYPEGVSFPGGERTTYTAAAMVLAADALSGASGAAGLWRGECLPAPADLDLATMQCAALTERCRT